VELFNVDRSWAHRAEVSNVSVTQSMTRQKLLSFAPWIPSADSKYAGHKYYFHHLTRLAEVFEVVVISCDVEENRKLLGEKTPWRTVLVPPLPKAAGLKGKLAALRLQGRWDPIPAINGIEFISEEQPEIVELHWSTTIYLAPRVRKLFPDAYIAGYQYDRYSSTLTWPKLRRLRLRRRILESVAGRVIAKQERRLARSCDLVAAFKQRDLKFVGNRASTMVIDPWLDPPISRAPGNETKDVLLVGAFDRVENEEGALWMINEVMPIVWLEQPTARLVLAGANPGPKLRQHEGPRVRVTGFVDDLSPFYAAAHCSVAPIFSGGGLRFKVPQALSHGIPLVATSESLAGLEGLGRACLAGVEDEAPGFAAAISRVLRDPVKGASDAASAKEWVLRRFSFDRSIQSVIDRYMVASSGDQ
jgi:glycosyltransferase involved in cell wall biosynthesis